MIKVLVVPPHAVQKTVAAQLADAVEVACLSFTLSAQNVRKSAKKGARVVVIGPDAQSDVHVSVENLSSIGISVQQVLQSLKSPRKVVIEGFSHLAIRLPAESVRRFALFLTARLRSSDVDAVFVVSKEGELGSVLPVLLQAADEVISGKGQ